MTALAAPKDSPRIGDDSVPDRLSFPIAANTFVHQGGMVCLDVNGRAVPAGSGAAVTTPVGVSLDEVDNTTADASFSGNSGLAGAADVEVMRGAFAMVSATAGDLITVPNVGSPCYIVDDQTVALTDNNGARKFAGFIVAVNTAASNGGPVFGDGSNDGRVYVQVGSDFVHPGVNPFGIQGILSIPIPLAAIVAGGGLVAAVSPNFAYRILSVSYSTTQAGAGAGATFALTLKINNVLVTGGGATITLANQTQGAELAGAAVTGANSGTKGQQITVNAAAGTVFTAGFLSVNINFG